MAHSPYYAVVYAYGKDGEEVAYMPCFTHEQVMARASKYDEVRVVLNGSATWFKLRLKPWEKERYALPATNDCASEFVRDQAPECTLDKGSGKARSTISPLQLSEAFYDGWKSYKRTPSW